MAAVSADARPLCSFEDFFADEFIRVIRFLVVAGAEPDDAAEASQQAFVEVYVRWDRVGRMAAPGAYVRRTALREWQRIVRRPRTDRERAQLGGWYDRRVVDEVYEHLEFAEVIAWLRGLPPRQRETLAWLYDGYDRREVAERMGMNKDTVRSIRALARAKFSASPRADAEEDSDG